VALRKLKKTLKPVIWVLTILFVVSLFVIGSAGAIGNKGVNPSGAAVKVKAKGLFSRYQKVTAREMEVAFYRAIENYKNGYYKNADEEYIKMMVFNEKIEEKILLSNAGKYGIKVTQKEIDDDFKKQTEGIEEEQLKMMLEAQGLTKSKIKKSISDALTAKKVREKIMEEYKATPEEIKNYYEENKYTQYADKEFKDVEAKVKEEVTNINKNKFYKKWMETEIKNSKIVVKYDEYKKYLRQTVDELDKYEITNITLRSKVFMSTLFAAEKKSEEQAIEEAKEELKKDAAIAKAAEEAGIKADANIDSESLFAYYKERYFQYIKKTYKVTDAELTEYYNKGNNKEKYNKKESIDAQIIYMALKLSDEDKKAAKDKAEKILAELKAGKDFTELAKANSEDPGSKDNGGDLGFFKKGQMVPEFEKAAFEGKTGEVYPTLVETQFGYHIIKTIEKKADGTEVRASHILIKTIPGEKTRTALKARADAIIANVNSGKIKMEDAVKVNSEIEKKDTFTGIQKDGSIDGIADSKEVSEALFTSKENEAKGVSVSNGYYVIKNVKYIPAKTPSFEEVKNKVTADFLNEKAAEEVEKVGKEKGPLMKFKSSKEEIAPVKTK
jgi:peptidyl-prolyl cis-trans isomerase D